MFHWRTSLVLLVSFCFITHGLRDRSEPACSKFHYEEQLLEKTIRLEIKFENLLEKIKKERQAMGKERLDEKQELQRWLDDSKADLNTKLKEMNDAVEAGEIKLSQQIAENQKLRDTTAAMVKDIVNTTPVAFEAHGVVKKGPQNEETILFQDIKVNEGGGYDKTTGVFTVPKDGIYLFMVQFCLKNSKDIYFDIVVDNKIEKAARFGNSDTGKHLCYSSQIVVKARANAKVMVKSGTNHDSDTIYSDVNRTNSFSGVLIGKL